MVEQIVIKRQEDTLDIPSQSSRAKWERPTVILATLKKTEFGPVSNPTFDGATTAAKVS